MKKTFVLPVVTGLVSVATLGSTFAFNGFGVMAEDEQGRQMMQQRIEIDETTRTAMHDAIINGNYAAYQAAVSTLENHPEVSEEDFDEIVVRAQERETRRAEAESRRQAVKDALDAGDFDAWKEVADEDLLAIIDTDAKFSQLMQMHEYQEAARTIADELGLPDRGPRGERDGEFGPRGNGDKMNMPMRAQQHQ